MAPRPASPASSLVGPEARTVPHPSGLVARLRGGDEDAMAEIFRESLDRIYNYCYRRTGSWSAAEDLCSTAFLEVWRHRARAVEVDGSVLPWVYGVATNVCRNHQRSQRRGRNADARVRLVDRLDDRDDGPDPGDVTAGRLDARRSLVQVLARVSELAQGDQDVFFLVCWEQLTYERAAAALAIPVGTVRSRLARVRRELRLTEGLELDA